MPIANEYGVRNEWADVTAALDSVDRVLSAIGNLAGWEADAQIYLSTLIRSAGACRTQLDILVSRGYVVLSRDGQNAMVAITMDGVESVLGPREPLFEVRP